MHSEPGTRWRRRVSFKFQDSAFTLNLGKRRAEVDVMKREISCQWSSVVQPVAWSVHRLSYAGSSQSQQIIRLLTAQYSNKEAKTASRCQHTHRPCVSLYWGRSCRWLRQGRELTSVITSWSTNTINFCTVSSHFIVCRHSIPLQLSLLHNIVSSSAVSKRVISFYRILWSKQEQCSKT